MSFVKRIVLFLALNILIVGTISILISVLGIRPYLNESGIDYGSLMAFCLIWGMGGAFISLALSRIMAKWMMGVKVIDPHTTDASLSELVSTVHQLARSAHLPVMPEVGIYDSPDINAFATGPTRSRSLVAVSTGLLSRMNRSEMEGVLGHEIAHISNGDMVTMTLLQGVVNAFVMFMARAIAFAISQASRRDDHSEGLGYFAQSMLVFVLEIVFMILGSIVIAWFSRFREYRADSGGARLAGREKMVAALQKLKRAFEGDSEVIAQADAAAPAFSAFKISSSSRWLYMFASHPPLEDRIRRLELSR